MTRLRSVAVAILITILASPPAIAQTVTADRAQFNVTNPPQQVSAGGAVLVGNPGPRTLYYWIVPRRHQENRRRQALTLSPTRP